jgi:hypothetical protein
MGTLNSGPDMTRGMGVVSRSMHLADMVCCRC